MKTKTCLLPVLSLALLLTAGCASSPMSHFYILPTPLKLNAGEQVDLSETKQVVGLLPVKIAAYLDRPQIVTRLSRDEIYVDEFNRWGIALPDSILNTLGMELLKKIPDTYIDVYPWSGGGKFDYQILVEIIQFDGKLGKTAGMTAQWTVTRGQNPDDIVERRIAFYQEPVPEATYGSLLQSMSKLVASLAGDISQSILNDPKPTAADIK
ncbi:MAG: membrane integrity-associated transporter subunit PqiC [Spartobacteria bacterium]|nr:membrane integrity-associated transporter subunit PqiC [Spartobacteria bacterium]